MISILTDKQKQLVTDNERLIYYGIRKFGYGKIDEFYGAASVGLCRAAETFNPDKKCAFSTYALRCICNEIRQDYRSIEKQKKFNCLSLEQNYEYNKAASPDGSNFRIEPQANDLIEPFEDTVVAHETLNRTRMKVNEKKAFGLYLTGHRQKEIAKRMGLSQPQVGRLIKIATKKLRKESEAELYAHGSTAKVSCR